MLIGITSDHGGFELKKYILENAEKLEELTGQQIIFKDLGTDNPESSDYPDFAEKIASEYNSGHIKLGILICKSGHGMCIAVNKFRNIRASLANTAESIINGKRDDDINMLCLSSNDVDGKYSLDIIAAFIVTEFLDEGNYKRRKDKVLEIEERNFK